MYYDLIIYTPMYVTAFWAILLLVSSGAKNRARQLLGVFMIFAFGVYFSHALYFKNQFEAYLLFDVIYVFSSLSVYPMYYWYIKLLTVESGFNLGNLKMFLPAFILSSVTGLVFILMSSSERMEYLRSYLFQLDEVKNHSSLLTIQHIVFVGGRIVFAIQVFVFIIWGRKLVIQYNSRIANFYSDLEDKKLVWVNLLLYSFFATSLMSIIFNLIGRTAFIDSIFLLLIPSSIFSVLLFFIGFQGYMQNHTVTNLVEDEKISSEFSLKEYNQAQLKDKLLTLFDQQKIYKQSDLKITQVALLLQTNRTYVSILINTEFKCTFSEFVNQYRILEAKKLMADSKQQNFTLEYISDVSGFGSVNSFIRIFKESEGLTPGKFKEKLLQSES